MATGVSVTSSSIADRFKQRTFRISRPNSRPIPYALRLTLPNHLQRRSWKAKNLRLCLVMEKKTEDVIQVEKENTVESADNIKNQVAASRVTERLARKRSERYTYLVAAIMSSLGVTSTAAVAIFYKSSWQMEGGEFPLFEMLGTFALSVGAAVGMEFWARWAHRALWHASLWNMHESHHRARDGTFELNDVFAITNAVPAIALLFYGSSQKGLIPGLCFGAGLGITVFGMAYMFVHDGLVHRRFPVGPIANVPYLRRVAAAHHLHHSDRFGGVPYGLFLGSKELEEVGGMEELEKEIQRMIRQSKGS
ncbi:beta-carotene hydroxylase 2, chloroplastic-like [Juglans microcarpa x Juglans regia]|uniref:beta-carotene hydroxylase 2, chloroplastic-like n=1 Tax=Juglans microcarpa x Juglans regia TaxID=2249226 RepID=UPI001B7DA48D|nr:beta-carotene hydroxylase 2, chloroplastic-like [Juglans microcarpa x Juglans regia]